MKELGKSPDVSSRVQDFSVLLAPFLLPSLQDVIELRDRTWVAHGWLMVPHYYICCS